MCGGPLKCGGPCSAEHVRTLVNPALAATNFATRNERKTHEGYGNFFLDPSMDRETIAKLSE